MSCASGGILVSSEGVRSIWLRHNLETFKNRLKALEEKAGKEGIDYTEEQMRALELLKREKAQDPDEIETEHPGYLLVQDTFYIAYLKSVGRIYQQTVLDTYSSLVFARLYTAKVPITAADILNDRVLPFFEEQGLSILRILTDWGTEFCGALDKHPYKIYLQYNEIEHTKTRKRRPQSNGICEVFHETVLNEFYRIAFRRKIYGEVEELQKDLNEWVEGYNNRRTHQGKRCQGITLIETAIAGLKLLKEKNLGNKFEGVSDTYQVK